MTRVLRGALCAAAAAIIVPRAAAAQEMEERPPTRDDLFFVEATVGFGVQFGETLYIPQDDGNEFTHPYTTGGAAGATAGFRLADELFLVGTYEYTQAANRDGEIEGVLADIDGEISYHVFVAGLRTTPDIGPGNVIAELAVGAQLPYKTELTFVYGPALEPAGITGKGTRTDEYSTGVGGRALFGYAWDLTDSLYVGGYWKFATYESNNNGERTVLDNFVTDLEADPPQATNAVIEYDDDGGEQPSAHSAQSTRLHFMIGASF